MVVVWTELDQMNYGLSKKMVTNLVTFCQLNLSKSYKKCLYNSLFYICLVETAGIELPSADFRKFCYFNKLSKYRNLPTIPLCAIVFRYVPLFPKVVTKLVTFLFIEVVSQVA
jgi:hypothetical protein